MHVILASRKLFFFCGEEGFWFEQLLSHCKIIIMANISAMVTNTLIRVPVVA